jgi:hypothetical protein
VWKDIPGYEGRYQASTDGQIRGCDREYTITPKDKKPYKRAHKGKILQECVGSNGYLYVGLRKSPAQKNAAFLPVHHLIAETFLGERPAGCQICHIDGRKTNCRADNLRYDSSRENHLDVYRCGSTYGKLTVAQAQDIKERLKKGESQSSIAKIFGISQTAVYYISKGVHFEWV